MQETEQTFVANEDDSIICAAIGYPVPDIVWLNDDESEVDMSRLIPGSAMATGVGNTFNVSVSMIVRRGDDGVYICNATNSIGNDAHTFNITVQCKFLIRLFCFDHVLFCSGTNPYHNRERTIAYGY